MYINAISNTQFEMIKKLIIEEKVDEAGPSFAEIARDLHEKFPDVSCTEPNRLNELKG